MSGAGPALIADLRALITKYAEECPPEELFDRVARAAGLLGVAARIRRAFEKDPSSIWEHDEATRALNGEAEAFLRRMTVVRCDKVSCLDGHTHIDAVVEVVPEPAVAAAGAKPGKKRRHPSPAEAPAPSTGALLQLHFTFRRRPLPASPEMNDGHGGEDPSDGSENGELSPIGAGVCKKEEAGNGAGSSSHGEEEIGHENGGGEGDDGGCGGCGDSECGDSGCGAGAQQRSGTMVSYNVSFSLDHGRPVPLLKLSILAHGDTPAPEIHEFDTGMHEEGEEGEGEKSDNGSDAANDGAGAGGAAAGKAGKGRCGGSGGSGDGNGGGGVSDDDQDDDGDKKDGSSADEEAILKGLLGNDEDAEGATPPAGAADMFWAEVDGDALSAAAKAAGLTGIGGAEGAALYWILLFPFYEEEWDIAGCLLRHCFGDDNESESGGEEEKGEEDGGGGCGEFGEGSDSDGGAKGGMIENPPIKRQRRNGTKE